MSTNDFSGKVALVTGAAGGIGSAVARALADAGAHVAAVDRDRAALDALGTPEAASGAGTITGFVADAARTEQVEAAVERIEESLGPVDFLVNGAGVLHPSPILELTEQDWEHTFAVNAGGVFRFSLAVARRMAPRGRGSIVTVASNSAGVPRVGMAAYGASKAAATAFTKNLGLELARYGIRCNVVAPGSTRTPMLSSLWSDDSGPARTLEGVLEDYRVGIPLNKFARPSDIADAVLFLLSDRAGHITMHDLYVDGGAALGR